MELITGYKELSKLLRINEANLCKKRQYVPKPIKNTKGNLIHYAWDYKEMEPYIDLAKNSISAQSFWRKVHEYNKQKKNANTKSIALKKNKKKAAGYDNT